MFSSRRRSRNRGVEPTEFEDTVAVAQAFSDLENGKIRRTFISTELFSWMLLATGMLLLSMFPYRLQKAYKKVHVRLVRKLEKKFSGKDVILVATRRIVRPPKKGSAVVRPRSRTLTAVHDAILENVVYPAEIVGKRVRYHSDGAKVMKILLDPKERTSTESKLNTYSSVYRRRLCGKDVVLYYPGGRECVRPLFC